MTRILSSWKITHNPDEFPLVLVDFGDWIDAELKPRVEKPLEVISIPDASFPFLRPAGNGSYRLRIGVMEEAATGIAARKAVLNRLLTIEGRNLQPLRIEIDGVADEYWEFDEAWFTSHDAEVEVSRGVYRTMRVYDITATKFALHEVV